MNRIPGLPGGTVPLTILVLLLATPARAYGIDGDAGRADDTWPDCRIIASVIGGAAGGLLGSALGASLERAVYGGNPDAGLTGGLVGMVVGGVAGVGLARKACGQSPENQLRAHLSLMWEHDRIAVGPSAVFIGDNMVYPIRRYSRRLELIDSVGSPPPSWRQARRPALGEVAIGADGTYRKSPQEWLRSFTVIDRLVVVGGDWLVVTHRDEINEYRRDDIIRADLYRIGSSLGKTWVDVGLPGPVLHGGECAWTLVDGPPSPWAIACLVPTDPAGR